MLYDLYLSTILIVKICFIGFFIMDKFNSTHLTKKGLLYTGNAFDILVSILIMYLFHPYSVNPIRVDHHTKLYLFTFALLTIIHIII